MMVLIILPHTQGALRAYRLGTQLTPEGMALGDQREI